MQVFSQLEILSGNSQIPLEFSYLLWLSFNELLEVFSLTRRFLAAKCKFYFFYGDVLHVKCCNKISNWKEKLCH